MKRTIKIMGAPVVIDFHVPTNEEYNTYSDGVGREIDANDDAGLVAHRVKYFDTWAEKITGMDKAAIPDKLKSSVMFKLFDVIEVTEKN